MARVTILKHHLQLYKDKRKMGWRGQIREVTRKRTKHKGMVVMQISVSAFSI